MHNLINLCFITQFTKKVEIFLREYIIMESTKTTPLEIMDTDFDLVEDMKNMQT
jgi:hypothetical protein